MILQQLVAQGLPLTATLAALTALLSLYFYLRLSYAITLTMSPNTVANTSPWRFTPKSHTTALTTAALLTSMLLPLAPAIVAALALYRLRLT